MSARWTASTAPTRIHSCTSTPKSASTAAPVSPRARLPRSSSTTTSPNSGRLTPSSTPTTSRPAGPPSEDCGTNSWGGGHRQPRRAPSQLLQRRRTAVSDGPTRPERDSMGELPVPADAYYGAQTQRAVVNFPISDLTMPPGMIHAHARIKGAAAQVNVDLGLLEAKIADAIVAAANEVAEGKLDDQFPIDVYQTGSGTTTNMNLNEVIAKRGTEILGADLCSELVPPNDHVNMGQARNDTIPTAIHIAALLAVEEELIPALEHLQEELCLLYTSD